MSVWGTGAQTWQDPAALDRAVVADVVAGAGHGAALVDRVLVTAPTDGATVGSQPEVSGTASPDGSVSVEPAGDGGGAALAGSVGTDGLWTVRNTDALAPGAYTVTAQSAAGSTDTLTVTVAASDGLPLHLVVTPRAVHVERLPDW